MDDAAFVDQTYIHPLGLTFIVVLGALTLVVPRRYALVPLLIMACFISPAQRVAVLGLDFNSIRLMIVAGWMRVFLRGETAGFRWSWLDTLFLAWTLSATVFFAVLWGGSGFVNRAGSHLFEQFGAYLLVRQLIRGWHDVVYLIAASAAIAVPCSAFFVVEWMTGRNMFSVFGGVPEITVVRAGRLRCQGPFPHAIIAGTAWAVWMPLMAGLWWGERQLRWLIVAGLAASSLIVIASASSTPIFAAASGAMAMCLYPFRRYIREIRWAVILAIIGLHIVMKAPVWHLLSRISAVGGSTGYHRFLLIDNFITHVGEWFFVGVHSTGHWGWGQEDVTNHYIVQGVTGGVVTLLCFLALIIWGFRLVGKTHRLVADDFPRSWFVWSVGATLFTHSMAFIGVSYFGQAHLLWALHLGLIGALHQFVYREYEALEEQQASDPAAADQRAAPAAS